MMISCCGFFFSPNREHIHCILRLWVFVCWHLPRLIHCARIRSSQENITFLKLLCSRWFFMWLSYFISPGESVMCKKLWAISSNDCHAYKKSASLSAYSMYWICIYSQPVKLRAKNTRRVGPRCKQQQLSRFSSVIFIKHKDYVEWRQTEV